MILIKRGYYFELSNEVRVLFPFDSTVLLIIGVAEEA